MNEEKNAKTSKKCVCLFKHIKTRSEISVLYFATVLTGFKPVSIRVNLFMNKYSL